MALVPERHAHERTPAMTSARDLDPLLRTLRSEIDALDIDDEEARRRLDALVADIGARSRDPNRSASDERLNGQLRASILKFEASHPRLAGVMNDVLEKLGTMGI
jgi:hypothetical protein